MNARAVPVDAEHAATVVADLAAGVGLPTPTTAEEVVEMLTKLDYDVTRGTVAEFARKKYFGPDPGDAWTPADVYAFMAALEARRRWRPTPSRHDMKKSGFRIEVERLQAEGVTPVHDLDDHTLEDLLLQIAQADNRMLREALLESINLKLRHFEE